jgi:hypothetical protein
MRQLGISGLLRGARHRARVRATRWLAMTRRHISAFSRQHSARVLHLPCPSEDRRAQGMPGEGFTHGPPATKKAGGSHHRFSRINRHSLRNGVTAYTCSRRCTGLVGHRPPGLLTRGLIPASGDRDHTISPSVPAALVSHGPHVHRIPHPTFVTIAKRPSESGAGCGEKYMISDFRKEENLRREGSIVGPA